jgi:hypothetical protein
MKPGREIRKFVMSKKPDPSVIDPAKTGSPPQSKPRCHQTGCATQNDAVIIQDGSTWVVPRHGGDMVFDSIVEARKYCDDNNLKIIQEQYS